MSVDDKSVQSRSRVDVLAYPPPTTARFVLLVIVLLTVGLFVGNWIYTEASGDFWTRTLAECLQQVSVDPAASSAGSTVLSAEVKLSVCMSSTEQVRGAWAVGCATITAGIALCIMYAAPVVIRRRRRLQEPSENLSAVVEHFKNLCTQNGLRRIPVLLIRPLGQNDAFCFGTPGRYAIALPKGAIVRWRDPAVFDALVRHELGHIRHHDVVLSWLARSIWYFVGPILAFPIIWGVIKGDISLASDYWWRAGILALLVESISRSVLRSRELDADIAAARGGDNLAALRACLTLRPSNALSGWAKSKSVFERHPTAGRRVEMVDSPHLVARVSFLDGVVSGLLAGAAAPLIVAPVVSLLTGTSEETFAGLPSALIIGPVLGGSVGLAVWRAAAVERALVFSGHSLHFRSTLLASAGVFAGLTVGQLVSLADVGAGFFGVDDPLLLVLPGLIAAGTVALSAALAHLWAEGIAGMSRPRHSWGLGLAANVLLFTVSAAVSESLQSSLNLLGWDVGRIWLLSDFPNGLIVASIGLFTILTVCGLYFRNRYGTLPPPPWLFESGRGFLLNASTEIPANRATRIPLGRFSLISGILTGSTMISTYLARRWLLGPAVTDLDLEVRLWEIIWMSALAWVCCSVAVLVALPHQGPIAGFLGGLVASTVCVVAFLAYNTWIGNRLYWDFVRFILYPSYTVGFILALLVNVFSLAIFGKGYRPKLGVAVGVVCALLVGVAVMSLGLTFTGSSQSLPPG